MNQKTSEWLQRGAGDYWDLEAGDVVACAAIVERWFNIPIGSEIQLRLSRKRQNQQGRLIRFECWGWHEDCWDYLVGRSSSALYDVAMAAITQLFPSRKHGDIRKLWLTCWYREPTP